MLHELLDHQTRPCVVGREQVAQLGDVVATAPAPRDLAEIQSVGNAVIDERGEPMLVDRVPESQLGSDALIEPAEQR